MLSQGRRGGAKDFMSRGPASDAWGMLHLEQGTHTTPTFSPASPFLSDSSFASGTVLTDWRWDSTSLWYGSTGSLRIMLLNVQSIRYSLAKAATYIKS